MPKSDTPKDRLKQAKIDYHNYLLIQYNKNVLDESKINYLRAQGLLPSQQFKKKAPSRRNKAANKITSRGIRTILDPFHFTSNIDLYKKDITDADWKPKNNLIHSDEFVDWINSMLYNPITRMDKYLKYEYYKVQAFRWLKDKDTIVDYATDDAKRQFIYREYERITQNTLYFAEKYGELKEGDISSGLVDYKAKEHHAIIFYLFDCGYNVIGGKGRQIGFTSAMGLAALKKLLIQTNYYIKFITEDKETGEEIFNDKIKYPFGALTSWLQPQVRGDSGNRFWLSDKQRKGDKGYPNSRIDVVAPKKTAINGGSPQLVLVDEIGNIGILTPMLNEGRPTMFWNDPVTGEFVLKRQVWMWGTGGEMDKGKGAYEKEWYRILGLWEAGLHENGFVPIFFSWHCRMTRDEYDKEKNWYYGARAGEKDIDLETSKTQFHQHYPSSFKDMFLTTANTLVSREIIENGLEKCNNLHERVAPVLGYFEPEYNYSDPMPPESDTPYRITGARFVPVSDEDMSKASTIMFQKPEKGWVWRYWQGTDPIATETGHSKMASSIWDDYNKTVSAVVNYRKKHDHKYAFLQVLLLGLYYDTQPIKTGVKELVEANIGTNYIDYKQLKGFFNSLIFNTQLPVKVMGGARDIGIDNKGNRADAIIDYMTEVLRNYHDRIYIKEIFNQLTTFVITVTQAGRETWGKLSKAMHHDDVLYSVAFAYICRLSYPHIHPYKNVMDAKNTKVRYILTRQSDGSLIRKATKQSFYKKPEKQHVN